MKRLVPSFPGIVDDIKKPGVTEHGYTRTPLKAIHSFFQSLAGADRRPPPDHRSAALLPGSPRTTWSTTRRSRSSPVASPPPEIIERDLLESYHVATLDNDAPQIFEESAEFIARVTAP